jgi:hypothetical protein
MSNEERHDRGSDSRPEWFADFERKLVDLIQEAPGAQTQDVGACLTVLIPRGAGADNAVFGGLVTSRDEKHERMAEELLTAVLWAMLADGVSPETLRDTFDDAMGMVEPMTTALDVLQLDDTEDSVVN